MKDGSKLKVLIYTIKEFGGPLLEMAPFEVCQVNEIVLPSLHFPAGHGCRAEMRRWLWNMFGPGKYLKSYHLKNDTRLSSGVLSKSGPTWAGDDMFTWQVLKHQTLQCFRFECWWIVEWKFLWPGMRGRLSPSHSRLSMHLSDYLGICENRSCSTQTDAYFSLSLELPEVAWNEHELDIELMSGVEVPQTCTYAQMNYVRICIVAHDRKVIVRNYVDARPWLVEAKDDRICAAKIQHWIIQDPRITKCSNASNLCSEAKDKFTSPACSVAARCAIKDCHELDLASSSKCARKEVCELCWPRSRRSQKPHVTAALVSFALAFGSSQRQLHFVPQRFKFGTFQVYLHFATLCVTSPVTQPLEMPWRLYSLICHEYL